MTDIEKKLAFLLATSPHLDTVSGSYDEAAMDLVANGVVPVVRCRDCKHRETVDCPMCHEEYHFDEDDGGDYSLWTRMVDPNGFCSYGERKEGAENG